MASKPKRKGKEDDPGHSLSTVIISTIIMIIISIMIIIFIIISSTVVISIIIVVIITIIRSSPSPSLSPPQGQGRTIPMVSVAEKLQKVPSSISIFLLIWKFPVYLQLSGCFSPAFWIRLKCPN
jgi:hypothetical protein